jgi:hypothetical protein
MAPARIMSVQLSISTVMVALDPSFLSAFLYLCCEYIAFKGADRYNAQGFYIGVPRRWRSTWRNAISGTKYQNEPILRAQLSSGKIHTSMWSFSISYRTSMIDKYLEK